MSFVAILTSLKSLFQGFVTCKNFILTGPKFWVVICHQYEISALTFLRCHVAVKPVVVLRIACEQALWGALQLGGKKKESLQLCFRNLNICIESMRNADWSYDISDDLSCVFQCAHSRLFLLCADWQKSDSSVTGEQQGNWTHNSNSRDVVASCPSFFHPTAKAPESLHSGYVEKCQAVFSGYTLNATTHMYNLPTIYMCYCSFTLHFFGNFR